MTRAPARTATRSRATRIAFTTIAMFLALFAMLSWRLARGEDPAIGSPSAQTTAQPVIHRKVVVRRKIVHVVADLPPVPAAPTPAPAPAASPAPTTTYSAPSTPQPAPAAAPAPAPAPVPTTRAS